MKHTKGAPAGVQKQWQRTWIPAHNMKAGTVTPTEATVGICKVWSFHPDTKQDVVFTIPIPVDWMGGTDVYAYPVFCTDVNLYATVRWGLQWLGIVRGISIAALGTTIEGNFQADGTGFVIPPKSEWLTLPGSAIGALKEELFQMDGRDFTTLAALAAKLYRAAPSPFDNHPGNARLLGLIIMYQAFV